MAHETDPLRPCEITAYFKPHIRKWLLRKLNPETAHVSPYSDTIAREFMDIITGLRLLECEPQEDKHRPLQRLRLVIQPPHMPGLDPRVNSRLNQYAEQLFNQEFRHFVDDQVQNWAMEKEVAISSFREQYGISEEDLPLRSSTLAYYRYEKTQGRKMKRGGRRRRKKKRS